MKQKLSPLVSDTMTVQASTGWDGESGNDIDNSGGGGLLVQSEVVVKHVRLRVARFAKDAIR